jgi:hypothetical protein
MCCTECERDVAIEFRDTEVSPPVFLCATCNKKRRDDDALYETVRLNFLNKMISLDAKCPVYGVPITLESDIHHVKGRYGYADQWAYENDISLLIDVRFFLACSRAGHRWIENSHNREMAMKKGWILTRQDTYHGYNKKMVSADESVLPNDLSGNTAEAPEGNTGDN